MPSRSTAIAFLALFAALAGSATAAKLTLDGKNIRKGTVTAKQIKDRSLTTRELSRAAITSLRGRLGTITGARITDGTVTLADLAPNSVGSTQVVDRSLSAGDIANDTLTQTELGVGSVGDTELADNSVGNGEIKGQAISRNQLRPSVLRTGTVTVAFTAIADGACQTQQVPGAAYSIPTGAFSGTVIEVETPIGLGDGYVVDGRSTDGDNLRIQVCNFTGTTQSPGSRNFNFVALGS